MEILKYPHPALLNRCTSVSVFGPTLRTLLDAMWETMIKANGVGLAANQVGLQYTMVVINGPNNERIDLVNPFVVNKSAIPANLREGCLSAPGEFLLVKDRMDWVQVRYWNSDGVAYTRTFYGIYAVCVQHELEHLEGKSFLENKSIPKKTRLELVRKWGMK